MIYNQVCRNDNHSLNFLMAAESKVLFQYKRCLMHNKKFTAKFIK